MQKKSERVPADSSLPCLKLKRKKWRLGIFNNNFQLKQSASTLTQPSSDCFKGYFTRNETWMLSPATIWGCEKWYCFPSSSSWNQYMAYCLWIYKLWITIYHMYRNYKHTVVVFIYFFSFHWCLSRSTHHSDCHRDDVILPPQPRSLWMFIGMFMRGGKCPNWS